MEKLHMNKLTPQLNIKKLSDFKSIELSGNVEKDQKLFQNFPESYNGAIRGQYVWTQTQTDVDVRVFIDQSIGSTKDLIVKLSPKTICIKTKGKQEDVVLLSGDWFADVKVEECTWSLIPNDHIHINLEKKKSRIWLSLLIDEPHISIKNLELVQNIEDLAEDEQNTVERLLYDENQKVQGLPTSKHKEIESILKDAWNKPGSPFFGSAIRHQ